MAEATPAAAAPATSSPAPASAASSVHAAPEGQSATPAAAPAAETPKVGTPVLTKAEVESFRAKARERSGLKPKPAAEAPVATTPVTPPSAAAQAAAEAIAPGAAPTATPPAEKPKDDTAAMLIERLTQVNATKRAVTEERQRLAAERVQHAEQLKDAETLAKIKEAASKKDWLGLLREIDPNLDPNEPAVGLFEKLNSRDPRNLSPEEVDAIVQKKLAEKEQKEKADREKAEVEAKERATATLESARDGFVAECASVYSSNAAAFPMVSARGVTRDELTRYVESQYPNIPGPAETMQYFEKLFREQAERAGYIPKPPDPVAPTPLAPAAVTPATVQADGGGKSPPPQKRRTVEEAREELKRRFRLASQQSG